MTALAPCLDPWALATLDALAEHIARTHGDTGQTTTARQTALLADLDQYQAEHGHPYRNPNARNATLRTHTDQAQR